MRTTTIGRAALVLAVLVIVAGCASGGRSPTGSPTTSTSVPTSPPTTAVPAASAAQLTSGTWSALPEAPISLRQGASVVWTGHELLVWGGQSGPQGETLHSDGAAYNPQTRTWRLLPAGPMSGRVGQATVWTGTEMVIWGGYDNVTNNTMQVTADGAAYNPTTNMWQLLPGSPLSARAGPQGLWTGSAVMILGGQPAVTTATTAQYSDGALYDPTTARWSLIPSPLPHDGHNLNWVASAAAGPTVLAWSDWWQVHQAGPNTSSMSGGVDLFGYDPATAAWHYLAVGPQALPDVEDAIWTGQDLYTRGITYNCGPCPGPFVPEATAVYDPAANTWTRLPADPLGGDHLLSVWTGAALFSFNSSGIYGSVGPGDASIYDPSTNTWTRTPGALFACDPPTDPVWTGQQILLYCPDLPAAQEPDTTDSPTRRAPRTKPSCT